MRLLFWQPMPWGPVALITATLSSGVCPVSTCANYSVFKTHLLVTNCNKYTRASPILKRLHWLPVEFCCIFKTATLVYKFLHNGHPSYFGLLLSTRCGRYSTIYNHPDKRFLEVPQFCPSIHKSKNNFGHSFAFDAPTVWIHLPDEVHSAPTLACFRKRLKSYLLKKAFPT